jgi:hypothetical protein
VKKRKVRKVKLVTTFSLTVVMLAMMAGLAMANPENIAITPGNQNIQPGQSTSDPGALYSTYTIKVTEIIQDSTPVGNTHAIGVTDVAVVTGTGSPSDLRYRFHYGGSNSLWVEKGLANSWQWDDGGNTAATLTMDVLDIGTSTDAVYRFKVRDEFLTHWGSEDEGLATAYGSAIPEFTTIAIPVASILGLLFYFNHRKRRKE